MSKETGLIVGHTVHLPNRRNVFVGRRNDYEGVFLRFYNAENENKPYHYLKLSSEAADTLRQLLGGSVEHAIPTELECGMGEIIVARVKFTLDDTGIEWEEVKSELERE